MNNNMQHARASRVVHVRQFRQADAATVAELFVEGMCSYEAHQNAYNEQYIASCLHSDLADVEAAYLARGGNFWVATMKASTLFAARGELLECDGDDNDDDVVVGSIGLHRTYSDSSEGEVRRLSVRSSCQGLGIGRLLMAHLEQWASANGIKRVNLSTGVAMRDAVAFYTKLGYTFEREEPESPEYMLACFSKTLP